MKLHECTNSRLTMRLRPLRRMAIWTLAACFTAIPVSSFAGVFISVAIAPPPLPIYVQPVVPGDGYIWTPGYWSYAGGGYFWVPGTWVLAPYAGALWTPGYWGWNNGFYVFNAGYWGPHVGFYGGINYGFGYGGVGYSGGYWNHGSFSYNRTVINNTTNNRVSFNGGRGGVMARATPQEQLALHDQHMAPLAAQQRQVSMAGQNRALRASVNHGAPAIAATQRAGVFSGNGVVRANGADPVRDAAAARATTNVAGSREARTSNAASRSNVTAQRTANSARASNVHTSSPRTTSNVAHSNNVQRSAQSSHATSHPVQHTNTAHQTYARSAPAARPAAPSHQQQARPQPQAHQQAQARQPARGGNQGEHKQQH